MEQIGNRGGEKEKGFGNHPKPLKFYVVRQPGFEPRVVGLEGQPDKAADKAFSSQIQGVIAKARGGRILPFLPVLSVFDLSSRLSARRCHAPGTCSSTYSSRVCSSTQHRLQDRPSRARSPLSPPTKRPARWSYRALSPVRLARVLPGSAVVRVGDSPRFSRGAWKKCRGKMEIVRALHLFGAWLHGFVLRAGRVS